MMLRVRERGDELLIEVTGVAGRQQRVLQALSECQRVGADGEPAAPGQVSVRAGANDMRIRLRSNGAFRFEATRIYSCLREALIERPATPGTAIGL